MSRAVSIAVLAREINRQRVTRSLYPLLNLSTLVQPRSPRTSSASVGEPYVDKNDKGTTPKSPEINAKALSKYKIGEKITRGEKIDILVKILVEANDNKESIYGCLDTFVAFEPEFPIASLKNVLGNLERQNQYHRVIQVIKWILSKGHGNTMGTYGQLIYALDVDHRPKEAHDIWMRKLNADLHSVSWRLCSLMISVYYRNDMLGNLVKLFKGLEAFNRKPIEKALVEKVANSYEMLGLPDEKERVLEKYKNLFDERPKRRGKKSKGSRKGKKKESG